MQKFNLREQLINSTMDSLKIDKNPFNYSTIEGFIEHITDEQLKQFYSSLFGDKHTYLSGMDRVSTVAETFKDLGYNEMYKSDIRKYIATIESLNTVIFDNAKKSGRTFEDEIKGTKFLSISDTEERYYNLIKPHCDIKVLISNIRLYENSSATFEAFEKAYFLNENIKKQNVLKNPLDKLQIKKG